MLAHINDRLKLESRVMGDYLAWFGEGFSIPIWDCRHHFVLKKRTVKFRGTFNSILRVNFLYGYGLSWNSRCELQIRNFLSEQTLYSLSSHFSQG